MFAGAHLDPENQPLRRFPGVVESERVFRHNYMAKTTVAWPGSGMFQRSNGPLRRRAAARVMNVPALWITSGSRAGRPQKLQNSIIPAETEGVAVRGPGSAHGRLGGFGRPQTGFGQARGVLRLVRNYAQPPGA